MQKPFSDRTRMVLRTSCAIARGVGLSEVSPPCLMLGILSVSGSVAYRALIRASVFSFEYLESRIRGVVGYAQGDEQDCPEVMSYTRDAELVLRAACQQAPPEYIGTEHLLLALFQSNDPTLSPIFQELQLFLPTVKEAVEQVLGTLIAESVVKKHT